MRSIYPLLLLLLISCKDQPAEKETTHEGEMTETAEETPPRVIAPFTQPVETAHQRDKVMKKTALSFEIDLDFRGEDRMDASVTMTPESDRILMVRQKGDTLLFDGEKVYISPSGAETEGARFDVFTWPYFFALPFKLNDPGTQWQDLGTTELDGAMRNAGKLTFEKGTGDAPDDWYVVYTDQSTNLIYAAAYIVTYGGRDVQKAEENAHAIRYTGYETIEGVPVATRWTFHNWSEEEGLGEQIGEARITNVRFIDPGKDFFSKTGDSKEVPAP
ncbi:heat-shock protein Hsp90 [Robertkochia aurantiaca]|uniref:heat-shock protein Hsp90 n=1 Tax=Robertkochia aurantiaca TaxID=2873700 RepID=UPI001CCC68D2|nr:heat-shock protein Hsp90 [Robertkochia sp. 3YJGBD-33]